MDRTPVRDGQSLDPVDAHHPRRVSVGLPGYLKLISFVGSHMLLVTIDRSLYHTRFGASREGQVPPLLMWGI